MDEMFDDEQPDKADIYEIFDSSPSEQNQPTKYKNTIHIGPFYQEEIVRIGLLAVLLGAISLSIATLFTPIGKWLQDILVQMRMFLGF